MAKFTITENGTNVMSVDGVSVDIVGRRVIVDGVEVFSAQEGTKELNIRINEGVINLKARGSVVAEGNINGPVDAGNSVTVAGSITGDVDAGNSVTVNGDVKGAIDAGNSVTIGGSHEGDIDAGGKVSIKGKK